MGIRSSCAVARITAWGGWRFFGCAGLCCAALRCAVLCKWADVMGESMGRLSAHARSDAMAALSKSTRLPSARMHSGP